MLPLLFLIPAAITGIAGVVKGASAVKKTSEAKDIAAEAQRIFSGAKAKLEAEQKTAREHLEALGQRKVLSWATEVQDFVSVFSLLKNVEQSGIPAEDAQRLAGLKVPNLPALRETSLKMAEVAGGTFLGTAGGGLLAIATYGGVMTLGTASTGAAIAGLSGAAATNATLAWLGGGSLAAGGGGMALGTAVLGGIVAGPALLIGGLVMNASAEKKLASARTDRAKAKEAAEEMANAGVALQGICAVADEVARIAEGLCDRTAQMLVHLKAIIRKFGTDYQKFDETSRAWVWATVESVTQLKDILEEPILTPEGALIPSIARFLKDRERFLQQTSAQKQIST